MSKTNKPLLAYHVGEGSEGEQVIVFATSSAAGRRKGGNELDLMFEEVEFCRRAPWADQYAGQPFIPAKAYHDAGWRLDCDHCGTQLYDDAEDDDGNPLQIVYDGRHAYCDSGCKAMREQYAGKGIAVCERWKDFNNFLADMGERPAGKTLDRENGDDGYHPGNCRWATPCEQARNTKRNVLNFESAVEVAKLRLSGVSCAAISAQFGISESLPREIVKGRCWKDALAQAKSELELTQ